MTDTKNNRILLVDDNQAIHQDFVKILGTGTGSADSAMSDARAGFFGDAEESTPDDSPSFELQSAYQGEEAYELVKQAIAEERPYAMAFVDVRMPPGWDGVQTIKKLWEVDPQLQVVICTAFADYSWDDMKDELGTSDRLLILKKPFDPVEVCQFATALTEKWNVALEAAQNLDAAQCAEQEARSYAASLEMLNRALETAKATAEAAAEAKSYFLANMSHEIRTPMIAILGYTDLLSDPDLEAPSRNEFVQTVQTNGRHLLSILDDILDLTRIESGNLAIKPVDFEPSSVVTEVLDMVKLRAAEKNLELVVNVADGLPQTIRADQTRIRQVLLNLVSNAVKFTERGTVTIDLQQIPQESGPGHDLSYVIRDTGIGIDPSEVDALFDAFTQADNSTTREYGGTGLGLSICKRLADILNGDISVESEVGVGSAFTFRIPCEEATAAVSEATPEAPEVVEADQDSNRSGALQARILLAEDFLPTQRLISMLLTKAGAQVDLASDGKQAVELTNQAADEDAPYDLIIMDMQMPVLDGYRATERIRTMGFGGPIVALTAHAMAGDREKCLKVGCTDYTTKPIDRRQLIKLCKSLITEFAAGAPLPGQTSEQTSREESNSN